MKLFKKIFKITALFFFLALVIIYYLFSSFSAPKSDKKIIGKFINSSIKPTITHETFASYKFRKLTIQKDTTLPTLVFVHGTIGSSTDFIEYMTDSLLLTKTNMVSYDRIGYNYKDSNSVQESIAFERDMLHDIIKNLHPKKTILVGYSYGGPIALAVKKEVKKVILLAPAVYSKVEPMPWAINLYKWKITRWLIPAIWKEASKEKISHKKDLQYFENNWKSSPNKILSIHGTNDWIVPFENSLFLQNQFPKEQFELTTIDNAGHGLIWSNFKEIKQQLLNQLD
ncbi:alpha/beta hydrolase [Tenacibaculum sp. AHE15PA]|uniref:alpha/beta fold hydrolase n=1 Tax=unclassified Tenacibaculum TaxID=2635139 RepID=UPI001C4F095F|nr:MULTISPECIES: alpha/beta hydrolase [unclassified Tenacibaculum]QXP74327.1 alpha/beta hydrolase [Tenacibaculum sp. AHE14PA]QXP75303.1 alpha/beta hydrolase [Tenacibaculum sp. AHE15PA]